MAGSGTGVHEGHKVFPHDHSGQIRDKDSTLPLRAPWCTGRWLCLTCASKDLPKGVWFTGPECKPAGAK